MTEAELEDLLERRRFADLVLGSESSDGEEAGEGREWVTHPLLEKERNLDALDLLEPRTERPKHLVRDLRHTLPVSSVNQPDPQRKRRGTFCTVRLLTIWSYARSFNSGKPILSAKR